MRTDPEIEALIGPPTKRKPDRPPGPGRPVADHRQKLVLEQARLTKVRADRLTEKLIDRAAVEAHWAEIVSTLRAALLAAPARIGAKLSWPQAAIDALDIEIREALAALAAAKGLPDDA